MVSNSPMNNFQYSLATRFSLCLPIKDFNGLGLRFYLLSCPMACERTFIIITPFYNTSIAYYFYLSREKCVFLSPADYNKGNNITAPNYIVYTIYIIAL
jgi:hypothetical protein